VRGKVDAPSGISRAQPDRPRQPPRALQPGAGRMRESATLRRWPACPLTARHLRRPCQPPQCVRDAAGPASLAPRLASPAVHTSPSANRETRSLHTFSQLTVPACHCQAHPHHHTSSTKCLPHTYVCKITHKFVITSVGRDNVSSALRSESPTPSSSARTVTQLLRRLAALCCVRHTRCGACLLSALRSLQQQVR